MNQPELTLIDPHTKALALQIFAFGDDSYFLKRNDSHYTIILVTEGSGKLYADLTEHVFNAPCLISFSVYETYSIRSSDTLKGILLNFHSDFFCIHKHQEEVACNGVLFNNIYASPIVQLGKDDLSALLTLVEQLKREMQQSGIGQYEMLISFLKIFLINASRIKYHHSNIQLPETKKQPFILQTLKDRIDEHYRQKRSASDYASLLNISVRALNRISKQHFNKTLSKLISDRIVIEAKRELYLTSKPVKAIAYELGFEDEFYFSRYFKTSTKVSPQTYRNSVGFARGESPETVEGQKKDLAGIGENNRSAGLTGT